MRFGEGYLPLIWKIYSKMPMFFKLDFVKIELQVEFNISNVEFYLKIYIELNFEDIEFYT